MVGLFNGHFIDVKALYALEFENISNISFIGELDVTKAFALINETMSADIVNIYQHSYFDHTEKNVLFNNTIFVLKDKRMIELGNNYCQVLYTSRQHDWANALIRSLSKFRVANQESAIGFSRQPVAN